MLTIFTIPKAFEGHNAIIQSNAIKSWTKLLPACEIILFGNDSGVKDAASRLGTLHYPEIETNEFGTPYLNCAFDKAQKVAKHDLILYVNSDIILFQDLITGIEKIRKDKFLLCGRRWDMDVESELNFEFCNWDIELRDKLIRTGKMHGLSGMDYFVFPRNLVKMPAFLVGRAGWDTWLIYFMRVNRVPVIDASNSIMILHQNHDYKHSSYGKKKRVSGPELSYNLTIAGGYSQMLSLRDADWELTQNCLRRPRFLKRFYSLLSPYPLWRNILAVKRRLVEKLQAFIEY